MTSNLLLILGLKLHFQSNFLAWFGNHMTLSLSNGYCNAFMLCVMLGLIEENNEAINGWKIGKYKGRAAQICTRGLGRCTRDLSKG